MNGFSIEYEIRIGFRISMDLALNNNLELDLELIGYRYIVRCRFRIM